MQGDDIEPNKEEKQEKLDQDFDRPFAAPSDASNNVPKDYPTNDTDIDETEWYQEGGASASSTEFPTRTHREHLPNGFGLVGEAKKPKKKKL